VSRQRVSAPQHLHHLASVVAVLTDGAMAHEAEELHKMAIRLDALEAIVRQVAALYGMPIYVRGAQGYESTARVCRLVEEARAVLAEDGSRA
jgi:acetoin utilization deacetylase AcuC-like enzyme